MMIVAIIWSKKGSYKIWPDDNNQGSTIKKAFTHIVAILPESEPDIEIKCGIIQILSLSSSWNPQERNILCFVLSGDQE